MNKKAQTLSMNTIIILIIAVVVLITITILWVNYGGAMFDSIRQQSNSSLELLPRK